MIFTNQPPLTVGIFNTLLTFISSIMVVSTSSYGRWIPLTAHLSGMDGSLFLLLPSLIVFVMSVVVGIVSETGTITNIVFFIVGITFGAIYIDRIGERKEEICIYDSEYESLITDPVAVLAFDDNFYYIRQKEKWGLVPKSNGVALSFSHKQCASKLNVWNQ